MILAENNHQPVLMTWLDVKGRGHTLVQVCGGEDITLTLGC